MSKKWKIIVAVVAALVMVVIAGAGWYMANQGWTPDTLAQGQNLTHSLEVHLIDDNGDKVPDRGVVDLPVGLVLERGFDRGAGHGTRTDPLAVRLLDDNGDGVPDRGVIDHSPKGTFNADSGSGRGQDFGSTRGRPFGLLLVPFCFIGGLIGLGLLTGLTIFFYRRRQPAWPVAPVSASAAPDEVQPMPNEVQPTPDEVQLAPDEVQSMPEEVQPAPGEVQPSPDETRLEPPAVGESTEDGSNEEAVDNTP